MQVTREKNEFGFYRAPSEFVTKHWEAIKPLIADALPPYIGKEEDLFASLIEAVIKEKMFVWLVIPADRSKGLDIVGGFTTYITKDPLTGSKSLVVYTLAASKELKGKGALRAIKEGFEKIKLYAKGKGCSRIVGSVRSPGLARQYQLLGGTLTSMVHWEI